MVLDRDLLTCPVDAMVVSGDGAQAGGLAFDAYGAHTGTLAWIVEDRNLNQALDAALKFAQDFQEPDIAESDRGVRLVHAHQS